MAVATTRPARPPPSPPPVDTFSQYPDRWFRDEYREKLFKMVRPITATTRRMQQRVVCRLPEHLVKEWLGDLKPADAVGVERGSDGSLVPTKETASLLRFNYTLRRGSVSDKVFSFQSDNLKSRLGRSAKPRAARTPRYPFKRGLGCAKLILKRAAQKRGKLARLLSMVVGNVLIKVKVPKFQRLMPTVEILAFVATMDHNGHINWPTAFEAAARAQLRTQFRSHLRTMLDDPNYPVDPVMEAAMTGTGTDSVRAVPVKRKMVAA